MPLRNENMTNQLDETNQNRAADFNQSHAPESNHFQEYPAD